MIFFSRALFGGWTLFITLLIGRTSGRVPVPAPEIWPFGEAAAVWVIVVGLPLFAVYLREIGDGP